MIRKSVAAFILASSLTVVGCGQSTLQTLAASVVGIQSAVIADGVSGNLSPADEGKILKVLTQLETAIAAYASGGPKQAVKDIWASGLKDIPQADQTKYAVLIGAVTGAVNAL